MRQTSILAGLGASLLTSPAFAHAGDHHGEGVAHFLAQHGLAAAIVALAVITGGVFFLKTKKKG